MNTNITSNISPPHSPPTPPSHHRHHQYHHLTSTIATLLFILPPISCLNSLYPFQEPLPIYKLSETQLDFPDIEHSWLDKGKVLRLHCPNNSNNLRLFQKQWSNAQPVVISNCHKNMDISLWTPQGFNREFGKRQTNQLISCNTNDPLKPHKMEKFWNGFESIKARVTNDNDEPLILKLKDWPPSDDFAEIMPKRYKNLMQSLPLPEYTHRNGVYNLASRLPEFFVKPDLGPKLYCAYGSPLNCSMGSTNLHLDISDAVNIMMYVGIPKDYYTSELDGAIRAMTEAGCCEYTMHRHTKNNELPGALWHIYNPQDSDKIRDLLNKVAKERGEEIAKHHDPIHDQSWYLDDYLRTRLRDEYYVNGHTIVQYLGDSIFIPAGAAHQVRNLSSCIKAAEDFVSPELIENCFRMTQEFRHLPNKHSNSEDKLQIKNIIYHTVKEAIAVLKN